jgi:hypothetical protein
MVALQQEIVSLKEGGATPTAIGGDPETPVSVNANLEELSRDQFADNILERVGKLIDPVRNAVASDKDSRTRESLTHQVHTANNAHEDFNKWHPEIMEMTKMHPTMDVETAYQNVRLQNPDKASGIDTDLKKVADEAAANDEKEEKSNVVRPVEFGGLLPTSGVVSEKKDGGMTSEEAGEAAWDACGMTKHLAAITDN